MNTYAKRASLVVSALAVTLMSTVVAFAVGEGTPPAFNLATTMTTAVTSIVNDLLAMIGSVLPVTITLLGAAIGVTYGIKFIRKIIK